MCLSLIPIWLIDFIGSVFTLILAFLCLSKAIFLYQKDKTNVVWIYFLWIAFGMLIFALSRGIGHIVRDILILFNKKDVWLKLRPYSGTFNTIAFILVASITLFFERIGVIYQNIIKDKLELEKKNKQISEFNKKLENLVQTKIKELEISEKKYRRIVELSNDAIIFTDINGYILEINEIGKNMFGYDKNLDNNKFLFDFFEIKQKFFEIKQNLLRGKNIRNIETTVINKKTNNKLYVLISCVKDSIYKDMDYTCYDKSFPKDILFYFFIKDITQRKEVESQLLRADKLASIGELASGIAHELNNPIGIILGYVQLIRKQKQNFCLDKDLEIIEKHAKSCKFIIDSLLKFSRKTKTIKQPANINNLIKESICLVKYILDKEKIQINLYLDKNIRDTLMDISKIQQVIINVLMNSYDAILKSNIATKEIKITTKENKNKIIIEIKDTGCGIEEKYLNKIFDPFFTTKEVGKGTGLGLSISYGIIKEHNGEVKVKSELGKGTVFTIMLPIQEVTQ